MTALATVSPSKKITWETFREMDIPEGDNSIYELINGEIMRRASPNSPHQRVSFKLSVEFGIYNKKKKAGEFFTAPFDVFFDEHTAEVQPDLLFVSNERSFIVQPNNGIVGAPDLIVEIISPGTVDRDRIMKKDVYERFAVKEYWVVDPAYKSVEVHVMENNRYQLFSFAEAKGKITSSVLPNFSLEVSKIFD
ncbi:MAG: Uma2 family endonuclease [Saprospiraceae bacterium]|nr:Uma2 family endonuclease [Saprospiraceae bacterium]